ncbi:MAG: hypothetical protein RIC52_06825, partial [Amphiplicatus sp.]
AAAQAQALGDILRNARRVVFNGNLIAELDTIGARISERRNANERVSRLIWRQRRSNQPSSPRA